MWRRVFWGTGVDVSRYNWRNPCKIHGSLKSARRNSFFFYFPTFLRAYLIGLLISSRFRLRPQAPVAWPRSGQVPFEIVKVRSCSAPAKFELQLLQGVVRLITDFVSEYLYLIFHPERNSEISKPLPPGASKYLLISSYYESFRIRGHVPRQYRQCSVAPQFLNKINGSGRT